MRALRIKRLDFGLAVKSLSDDGLFSGYGSVFGNVDAWGDVVERGAFIKSLESRQPVMLWQHDSRQPIGVWRSLSEDNMGLKIEGQLLVGKVAKATEAWELLKAGAISGLSIGYEAKEWSWSKNDQGDKICHLKEIDLWEVSLVTFPANDLARTEQIKSIESLREAEESLRDAGFSRSEAKTMISRIRDIQRDAEGEKVALKSAERFLKALKGH